MASTASNAREASKQAASTAVEESKEAAATVREAAGAVGQQVRQQAGEVTADLKGQAEQVVHETKAQLRSHADDQRSHLADAFGRFADELDALCKGRPDDAGTARHYVEQASTTLGGLGSQLREQTFDGLVDDVQRFARRRPGVFLAATAAAGLVAGRLARALNEGEAERSPGQSPPGQAQTTPPQKRSTADDEGSGRASHQHADR